MKDSGKNKLNNDHTFEAIFHQYYSPLCNYAFKVVGDGDVAEDLVQNLFIQLWEKNIIPQISNIEHYLLRSIKFKCIDYLRHKDVRREVHMDEFPDEASDTLSDISEEEIEPLLYYFAAKLPLKTRKVFLLSRKSGLTYKEIAKKMGISVKTVENQMGRALKQLKVLLKAHKFISLIPFI